jgi:branched-chain amino acid transport system substrate-binding protein
MKLRKRSLLALVATLVFVAMVTAGCGGGTSGTSSTGTSGTTTEVKIGIGAPLTAGAVALGEGMQRGAELAIAQANASETVKAAGLKFVGVPGDDQGDPTKGATVANSFASDPAIVGVMGHLNSGVSIPASKIYSRAKIVQISPASTNPQLTLQGLKNVFRVCTIDSVQGPAAADYAFNDLGFKSAYVVDDSTPYGEGLASEFAKQFAADGGKVLGTAKTSDKDTDFNALVTKMKGLNPDVVYYGGIYNSGALLSKQWSEAGGKGPIMGGDGLYDPTYIKLAGAANAEGDYCTSVGLPLSQLPAGGEFKAAYEKMFPGKELAAYDAYAYDATNIIIAATVKAAEAVGADKVTSTEGRDAIIGNVAVFNGNGVTGACSFDPNGDTTNKAITLYVVKNGAWVPWTK